MLRVEWEVDDGYVGNAPQYTEIPLEEFEYCETVDEALDLVESYVHDDFEMRMGWVFRGYSNLIEELGAIIEEVI